MNDPRDALDDMLTDTLKRIAALIPTNPIAESVYNALTALLIMVRHGEYRQSGGDEIRRCLDDAARLLIPAD